MLSFKIVDEDGKEFGFACTDDCPATIFFEPKDDVLEVPDIYDDFFRKWAPEGEWNGLKRSGIALMSGCTVEEFWELLMDMLVFTGQQILEEDMIDSYLEAKDHIKKIEDRRERKLVKERMLSRLGIVHTRLRSPGEEIDSLESFGSFLHLLTAGCARHLDEGARVEIASEEAPKELVPFLEYLERTKGDS